MVQKNNGAFRKYVGTRSIQMTIALSFTVVSVCCLCFLGVLLYKQFSRKKKH